MRCQVDRKRIAVDDLQPPRIMRRDLGQRRQAAPVPLDRDDAARAIGQQRPRQPAGAGADLQHHVFGPGQQQHGDAAADILALQKMLPKALFGPGLAVC